MRANLPLKIAITASGCKQKDIARRARIDQWRLSRIVTNDVVAKPEERSRLARVLRRSEEELFTGATP